MTKHYQHLFSCFEKWAIDSSAVLKGDVVRLVCFDLKDEIFEKLVEPSDEFDVLTLQALQLIFAALIVKMKCMLEDHLTDGKYAEELFPEFCKETQSVEKTNVMPERDFGMLDRLIVEKPCATTLFKKIRREREETVFQLIKK